MTGKLLASIPAGDQALEGILELPAAPRGVVLFAHGSGSGRFSPRNNMVAAALRENGIATLLLDLLTPQEEARIGNRFDIDLLAARLEAASTWLATQATTASLSLACSARAPAPRHLCAWQPTGRTGSPPLSRAVVGPTWREQPWSGCARRRY